MGEPKGQWPNQSNRGLQIPNEYSVLRLLMSHFDLMGMAIQTCLEYIKNLRRICSNFCIRQVGYICMFSEFRT